MTADIHSSRDMRQGQLDILYKNLSPSLLTSVVMAIVVASYAFVQHSGMESFVWLLSMFVVSAARYSTVQRYLTHDNDDELPEKAYRAYNIGALAGGAVWGLAPFIMFVDNTVDYKMFLLYGLASISAAALAGYSASVVTYLCFTAPIVFLSSLNLILSGDDLLFMMSLMVIVYFGLLTLTAMRMESYICNVLQLNAKSAGLERQNLEQLERISAQKAQLADQEFALESEGVWTWEMDTNFVVRSVSLMFQQKTGIKAHALIGKSLLDLEVPDQDINARLRQFQEKLRDRQVLNGFELILLRSNGNRAYVTLNAMPMRDEDNQLIGYRGTGRDVSAERHAMRQLQYHATHDSLTDLVNRRHFYQLLRQQLEMSSQAGFFLAYIDLERLNIVNETAGHVAGDALLKHLAQTLRESLDDTLTLARVGGDEFALLIEQSSLDDAVDVLERMLAQVRAFRFQWEGQSFSVGAFVGLVPVTRTDLSVAELVRHADHACFIAREQGGKGIHIANISEQRDLLSDKDSASVQLMFSALDNDRLTLLYQPIASLEENRINHYEVLLGLKGDFGGSDSAGRYLPAAERYGAMAHFDRRVIHDAFKHFHHFQAQEPEAGLFVNLSGSNLDNAAFFDFIREQMARYSVPREKVCFEITETAAVNKVDEAVALMKCLRSSGCRFALDDFGTGLASLGYLKQFPVDYVKMDGSLIRGLHDDPVDQAMLRAVIDLGTTMGFKIVAESVEDPELFTPLREAGVAYVQGYAVGYPVSLADLGSVSATAQQGKNPLKLV